MQKHLSIVAAAALTVGGMGYTAAWADSAANPNDPAAQPTPANAAQRAGENAETAADRAAAGQGLKGTAQAPDAEGIRDVLASSTEAAFTPGGFDDLVERFVDADRNRIGQAMPSDEELSALNDQIRAFRDAWKAKYNQEFDIENEELVFASGYQIMQGEIGDRARTAGERQPGDPAVTGTVETRETSGSVTVDPNAPRDPNAPAGERVENAAERTGEAVRDAADATGDAARNAADRAQQATGVDAPGNDASDRNLNDPGRNIATVTIAASHGKPEVKVPMIHEAGGWKLDIPDSMDAAKFRDSVKEAMSKVGSMKAEWPADPNEAYRAVSHEVLAAIFADGAGDSSAQPAGFGSQPDAGQGLGSQPNAGQDLNRDPAAPATPAEPATPAQPQ